MLNRNNFTKKNRFIVALFFEIVGSFFISVLKVLSILDKKSRELQSVKKILILRNDGIGDTLLTIPLLQSLKEIYPEAKIDVMIKSKAREILNSNPLVNNIIITDNGKSFIDIFFTLRKEKYDIIISPRPDNYIFHHFLSFILNGKRRVGYAHKGGSFLLTDVVPWNGEKVIVELLLDIGRYLGNFTAVGFPELFISEEDKKFVEEKISEKGINKYELKVGINPSAGHPFIWPVDNWVKVIEELKRSYNVAIVFLGDSSSVPFINRIRDNLNFTTYSFAGETTLSQTTAIVKWLDFIITVDSAIRHIANMFNKDIVVIRNGANSNLMWGKYCETENVLFHNVPCSPCGKKYCPENKRVCMIGIKPEEVLLNVGRVLAKKININNDK